MRVKEKDLAGLSYIQREQSFVHHTYDEECRLFELIKRGEERVVELDSRKFCGAHNGHLSNDPLRDKKYLFVVETTLAARAAIEGGVPEQTAYNLGDLYVQQADLCQSIAQVEKLHREMVADYTRRSASVKKQTIDSRPVLQCMDYIHWNMHKRITVRELAEHVGLTPSYLSVLFKEKTGLSVSEYIRQNKVEAAKNMLRYTKLGYAEIAATLSFSSQSHMARLVRQNTGMTPREYRNFYFKNEENLLPSVEVKPELYAGDTLLEEKEAQIK